VRIESQLLWHEADFYHWANTELQQTIVDLIDIREVVDRVALLILVIEPDFVMEDGMKAHVLEICYLLDRPQVVSVAFAERQDGATGAEHLLPEMREGCGLRRGVNLDLLLGPGLRDDAEMQQCGAEDYKSNGSESHHIILALPLWRNATIRKSLVGTLKGF